MQRGGAFGRQSPREASKGRKNKRFVCGKQSGFRGVLWVASKQANEGFVKRFSVWKQSLSRRARVSKQANEREAACTSSLPFWGSGRGGLHVESAIDSYEEVILP